MSPASKPGTRKVGKPVCVIAVMETVRLSDAQVMQMYDKNSRGGGAAWRAKEKGRPIVKWSKGHTKDQMLELNRTLPLPYVLHFRVPSGGTSQSYLACHPFQIDAGATTGFSGKTQRVDDNPESGYVLFHNGFWANWRNKLEEMSLRGAWRVPSGPWSDSRGLALAAYHIGLGFLELVNEKVIAFGPGDEDLEFFGDWESIENTDDKGNKQSIAVSNLTWRSFTAPNPVHADWHGRHHNRAPNSKSDKATTIEVNDKRRITGDDSGVGGAAGSTAATFPAGDAEIGRATGEGNAEAESIQEEDKEIAKTVGVQRGDVGRLIRRNQCAACSKPTTVLTLHGAKLYCAQCWSKQIKQSPTIIGDCYLCKTSRTASRRKDTHEWMCITCWKTNGRPKSYYETGTGERIQFSDGND